MHSNTFKEIKPPLMKWLPKFLNALQAIPDIFHIYIL